MRLYYLAYGSNLNIEQMKRRCPNATKIGTAWLNDYELAFNTHLTVRKKKGSMVPVGVWDITTTDESFLDRYEGYPTYYRKEYIDVNCNGKDIKGLIYIMNEDVPMNTPPSFRYYHTCLEGYNDFELDRSYLDKAYEDALKETK